MPPWNERQIILYILTLIVTKALLGEDQQFEVLKISNVPFPSSSGYAAHTRTTNQKNISEYTLCYRHLVESYNDGLYCPVNIGS